METPLPLPPSSGSAPSSANSFVTDAGVSDHVTSKSHFVDLARVVKRTPAEGDHRCRCFYERYDTNFALLLQTFVETTEMLVQRLNRIFVML